MNLALFRSLLTAQAAGASPTASAMVATDREPYGDSVRLRKSGQLYPKPVWMYLIYVGMKNNGLFAKHVAGRVGAATLDADQDALIAQARAGQNLVGRDFDKIEFDRPCYFSIVVNIKDWEFYYPFPDLAEINDPDTHDPIIFTSSKRIIVNGQPFSRSVTRNRSFYDLEPITPVIDGVPRQGIRCINYLKRNELGDDIQPQEKLDYSFNLLLHVPFSDDAPARKVLVIIDPDGQNQGPGAGSTDVGGTRITAKQDEDEALEPAE